MDGDKNYLLCLYCGHKVCPQSQLCFFRQGHSGLHLIFKPELKGEFIMLDNPNVSARKLSPKTIHCTSCDLKVGKHCRIGPGARLTFCFDRDSVKLEGLARKPKAWKEVMALLPQIKCRGSEDFFVGSDKQASSSDYLESKPIRISLRFLPVVQGELVAGPVDYDVDALTKTKARDYQLELFAHCIGGNHVLFLPTGAGKTLIAAMVIQRMKQINHPGKYVAFVVDRVPLVYQQGVYLEKETELNVAMLHGECNLKEREETRRDADVIVVTAMVFLNMLHRKQISIADCCLLVIDECHHAQGNHPYAKLMQEYYLECPPPLQPQILGLSASPPGAKDMVTTNRHLKELCEVMHAKIVTPCEASSSLKDSAQKCHTAYKPVTPSNMECRLMEALEKHIRVIEGHLRKSVGEELLPHLTSDLYGPKGRRALRHMRRVAIENKWEEATILLDHLLYLEKVVEMNNIIGPSFSLHEVKEDLLYSGVKASNRQLMQDLEKAMSKVLNPKDGVCLSSRMVLLLKELEDTYQASKLKARIIVFVEKRKTARRLTDFLGRHDKIKELLPSMMVGHGTYEGMSWQEEQKPLLDRFKSGIVKLLVSTSVVEEGLDVPACNLVIRFNGLSSTTALVQSRGRARQAISRFVVICEDKELKRMADIRDKENNMVAAVQCAMMRAGVRSPKAAFLKDVMERRSKTEVDGTMETQELSDRTSHPELQYAGKAGHADSYVVRLMLLPDNVNKDEVVKAFSPYGEVKKVRTKDGLLHMMASKGEEPWQSFLRLAESANIEVQGHPIWLACHKHEIEVKESIELPISRLSLGMMTSPTEFQEVYTKSKDPGQVRWQGKDRMLQLEAKDVRVDIRWKTVRQTVLLSRSTMDENARLFIPVKDCPLLYSLNPLLLDDGKAEDDLNWQRCVEDKELNLAASQCFVYCIEIRKKDIPPDVIRDLEALLRHHSITLWHGHVCSLKTQSIQDDDREGLMRGLSLPHPMLYAMYCLKSRHAPLLPLAFPTLESLRYLKSQSDSDAILKLGNLSLKLSSFSPPAPPSSPLHLLHRTSGVVSLSVEQFQRLLEETTPSSGVPRAPSGCVLVRRILVTPLRIIYRDLQAIIGNRVVRYLESPEEELMLVKFVDENLKALRGGSPAIVERVQEVLLSGIILPGGKRYEFLGCSATQMREQSCWMTSKNAQELRDWIGNFEDIRSPGKYLARIGQALSSTVATVEIPSYRRIPDIKNDKYCFTDGIGKLSLSCAKKVMTYLGTSLPNDRIPSAFQIRLAGCKGVLAIDPTISDTDQQAHIRPSMEKFESDHKTLEIVSYTHSLPLHLNRQAITLLSAAGVPDDVFIALQENHLENLIKGLTEPTVSIKWLQAHTAAGFLGSLPPRTPFKDPFLCSLLHSIYSRQSTDLRRKAWIHVPQGRLLMGVADETKTLQYGEVYFRYTTSILDDSLNDTSLPLSCCAHPYKLPTKTGLGKVQQLKDEDLVVVWKNPCLYPGDIRLLKFRDIPALDHMVDCIVFPCQGDRPHAFECSGSDLDGDLFSVTWMKDLIPKEANHSPLDYDSVSAREIDRPIELPEMVGIITDVMENNKLGVIAQAWLATADHVQGGAWSDDCKVLARLHAIQVDFPKSGQSVKVPKRLFQNLKYPDFMEKPEEAGESYVSRNVLGKLYRRCKHLDRGGGCWEAAGLYSPDPEMVVEGYQAYMKKANEDYGQYCHAIQGLLRLYGVGSEAEGMIGSVAEELREHLMAEMVAWKSKLMDQELEDDERDKKASAWYVTAYQDEDLVSRCLSFAWIVRDILERRKLQRRKSTGTEDSADIDVWIEEVSGCLKGMLMEESTKMKEGLMERKEICQRIQKIVSQVLPSDTEVFLFGSSALLLYDRLSDVDIYVGKEGLDWNKDEQIEVLKSITAPLRTAFPSTSGIFAPAVPILRSLSPDLDNHQVDVSASRRGPLKTAIIFSYLEQYPPLYPLLFHLVRWSRSNGLISHAVDNATSLLNTSGLCLLCIQYLESIKALSKLPSPENLATLDGISKIFELQYLQADGQNKIDHHLFLNGWDAGRALIGFYKHFSSPHAARVSVPDPVKTDMMAVDLEGEALAVFIEECHFAYHLLALTRSTETLLMAKRRKVLVKLTSLTSERFRGSEEFLAERIERSSGAKVRVFAAEKDALSASCLVVEIAGSAEEIAEGQRNLTAICTTLQSLIEKYLRGKSDMMFVENSNVVLFEGSWMVTDPVGFTRFYGKTHYHHKEKEVHEPMLMAPIEVKSQWEDHVKARLSEACQRQMLLLDEMAKKKLDVGKVEAVLRYGRFYVLNVGKLFSEGGMGKTTVKELELQVTKGRKSWKPWIKPKTPEEMLIELDDGEGPGGRRGKKKKNKIKEKGLSCSFFTGYRGPETLQEWLLREGFQPLESEKGVKRIKASVFAEHREILVAFSEELTIVRVKEKPVRWLSATFISNRRGREEDRDLSDWRFYINSQTDFKDMTWFEGKGPILMVEEGEYHVSEGFRETLLFLREQKGQDYVRADGVKVRISRVVSHSLVNKAGKFTFRDEHDELEIFFPVPSLSSCNRYHEFAEKVWDISQKFSKENFTKL